MGGGEVLSQSGDDNNIFNDEKRVDPYSQGNLIRLRGKSFTSQSDLVADVLDPEVIADIDRKADAFEKRMAVIVGIEDEETRSPVEIDEAEVGKEG